MIEKRNYPIISVFIEDVYPGSYEQHDGNENANSESTLKILAYSKISEVTKEKSLKFSHELIKYFTSHLLLHHFQDDVPVFSVYLEVNGDKMDINTHGGYYSKFIELIPPLQNSLKELLTLTKKDLDMENENIETIIMELESMSRFDIKFYPSKDTSEYKDISENEELDWIITRMIRTPNSEAYALYLNGENAGEIHLHIGKTIDSTIISTVNITEKEKAELMGHVHEVLLEPLEEELSTKSTMRFYSEALEDI